jgi:methyl-accepting chemotaxis protein
MRRFADLRLRIKLGLLALIPVLLIAALVVAVDRQLGRIDRQRVAEQQASGAERSVRAIAMESAGFARFNQQIRLAQSATAVEALRQQVGETAGRLVREIEAVAATGAPGGAREGSAALVAAVRGVERAVAEAAELRRRLIATREDRLFPDGQVFDLRFEGVLAALPLEGLSSTTEEQLRDRLTSVGAAVSELRLGAVSYLATEDRAQIQKIRRAAATARANMQGALSVSVAPSMRADLEELGRVVAAVAEAALAVATLRGESAAHEDHTVAPAIAALEIAAGAVGATFAAAAQAARDEAAAVGAEAKATLVALGAAIVALLIGTALLTIQIVARPVARLSGLLERIAAGDTRFVLSTTARRDEIGQMQSAIATLRSTVERAFAQSQMLDQLPVAVMVTDPRDDFRITYMNDETRRVLRTVEHLLPAKVDELMGRSIDIFHSDPARVRAVVSDPANLPHRAQIRLGPETIDLKINAVTDASGTYVGAMLIWSLVTAQVKLADDFEASVGQVARKIGEGATGMKTVAEAMSEVASESGKRAVAVAAATDQASANVQTVAASAEELAASVQEIGRQVAESARMAADAAREAEATDATVASLAEAASRIGDVVRLIGDIAGQTNLLALNATIEAARAGEAGKGFAVVASEVKNLAGQTAKATDEIAAQITAMQQATDRSVSAIRDIAGRIGRINEIAAGIAAAVEEQGAATAEIARSVQQAASGTSEVSSSIGAVSAAVEQTGEQAAHVLAAANELSGEAESLRSAVERFLAEVRGRSA